MRTKKLVYCALFATIIAAASQICIPLQPIPFNLALIAVLLSGGMLGKGYGTASVVVYIVLGAIGVPVFASFRGGLSVITGVTGGYIAGYVIVAFLTGLVCERTKKMRIVIPTMIVAVALCNVVGTAWFCFVSGTNVLGAVMICVLPYVIPDVLKIIMSAWIIKNKRWIK